MYLPDVGATLCVLSDVCSVPDGIPAGTAPASRVCRFILHPWQHQFWTTQELPGITTYDVLGPVTNEASWHLAP